MTTDPEIQAMSEIAEALSSLDDDSARERVLSWAMARYTPSLELSGDSSTSPEDQTDSTEIEEFGDLGELYDAASPSTEAEKVLVTSCWFQEMESHSEIDALTVNNALKQLGHGIGNITREFTNLQSNQPTLVRQIQKTGTSRQARKRYRVTRAGIRRVERMLMQTEG